MMNISLSDVISLSALLFSVFVYIRQKRDGQKVEDLKEILLNQQQELNALNLRKEKNIEISVFITSLPSGSKKLNFKNISISTALDFKVELPDEFMEMCFKVPTLPVKLQSGESVSFSYAPDSDSPEKIEVNMCWNTIDSTKEHTESKIVDL